MTSVRTLKEVKEAPAIIEESGKYDRIEIPSGTICRIIKKITKDEGLAAGMLVSCTIDGIKYSSVVLHDYNRNGYEIVEGPSKNNEVRVAEPTALEGKAGGRRKRRATKKARRHHRRYSRRNRS